MKEAVKYGIILLIICAAASGLLAAMNLLTKGKIEAQAMAEQSRALKEVLPEAVDFEPMTREGKVDYYKGLDAAGVMRGIAFMAEGKGYSSVIVTAVGMALDGKITAIKILSQNETPGLGSRVQEVKSDVTLFDAIAGKKETAAAPWFQEQFAGKNAAELAGVDAISGATVSSRAVMESIKEKAENILKSLVDS